MDSPTHKDDSDGQQIVQTYSYDQPPEQDSEGISQASNIARPTTMLQLPLATSMQSHARPDYTAFQDQYGYLPRGQVPHADAEITNTSYHSSSGYIPPVYGSHSSVAAYPTGSRVVQGVGAVASSWPDIQEQSQPYGPNTHITTASYYNPSTSAQPATSDAQQIYNAASQLQPPS
ncbi:hypothetical protein WOLCODRAFT_165575 [Wolfiporia cocos MD-104 SS10]|uniref:Uncharacterized protein n=1 Tax=Wolfiporia cocos (strain MD-104) TaxID=742152 RepID=A0A2H3K1J0_WOLCO|nr:hypothetical protein WOLCODRAFT_165575 [Wolfiporia cocos MD-104 SS10]